MPRSEKLSLLTSTPRQVAAAIALALALLTLAAGAAQAKVVVIGGKSFGVTPTPKAVAQSTALGRIRPLTVGGHQPLLEYHNGPLMLSSKLYLIFWGPENSFAKSYTEPIIQYAKDLESDESLTTDEFSVAEQYANKASEHITGKVTFGGDLFDTTTYPKREPAGGCPETGQCVSDAQIRAEILKDIEAQGWPTDTSGKPEAEYLMYTPEGVANCIEPNECTFSEFGFCAYHAEITAIAPSNHVAPYSDLPYMGECDSGQAPTGVSGNKDTDGTLDSEIHEIVESATDPDDESGYFDKNGEEVADKCTFPTVEEQPEIYGTPLGGSLEGSTAFNQLIHGDTYYTQQIWSNAPTQMPATSEPAGCVARIGPTPSFTAPTTAKTGQPVAFDGSGSYDVEHPLTAYEWDYGDGSPTDTASGATATHYYIAPGTYDATLTVGDSSGSTDASTQTLPIVVTGSTIAAPTASIASPANGQNFTLGETVEANFSCKEATGGPGIEACEDSNNTTSPGTLDTSTLGTHTYTVTARSLDGLVGTAQIEYAVVEPSGGSGGSGNGSGDGGSGAGNTPAAGGNLGLGTLSNLSAPPGTATSLSTGATTKVSSGGASSRLTRALRLCRKQPKKKRARCIAAAKKHYGSRMHRAAKKRR